MHKNITLSWICCGAYDTSVRTFSYNSIFQFSCLARSGYKSCINANVHGFLHISSYNAWYSLLFDCTMHRICGFNATHKTIDGGTLLPVPYVIFMFCMLFFVCKNNQ